MKFVVPEMHVERITVQDIITTSGDIQTPGAGGNYGGAGDDD